MIAATPGLRIVADYRSGGPFRQSAPAHRRAVSGAVSRGLRRRRADGRAKVRSAEPLRDWLDHCTADTPPRPAKK